MIIVSSNNPAFKLRTQPSASYNSFAVRLDLTSEDTNVSQSVTNVTASYDSNDYLNISASFTLDYDDPYTINIVQYSASLSTNLYSGEIMRTTASATVIDAPPFTSYTGSSNDFIIW